MVNCGTRLAQCCTAADCRKWLEFPDLELLIGKWGEEYMFWDKRHPCTMCGRLAHFMASPGPSTPYRPLLTGLKAEQVRREFLRSFGFTARDIKRIQLHAESLRGDFLPAALNDLDVPYRVGACFPGHECYTTGQILGEWAGRTLLWWRMNAPEEEVWRRKRRSGPKPLP